MFEFEPDEYIFSEVKDDENPYIIKEYYVCTHEQNNSFDIVNRFHNLEKEVNNKRTQQSFLVPKQEIIDNDWDLSINRYKEIVYEEITYEKPATLIQQIKELDSQRNNALSNLEKMMQ